MKIAFVKKNPQIRILKQAWGLKKRSRYHLTLVAESYDPNLFDKVFDEIITFGSSLNPKLRIRGVGRINSMLGLWQLKHILERLDVDIIHAHAEPNSIPAIAIRHAKAPVVYDAYDLTSVRLNEKYLSEQEIRDEKFCFENAAGIVHKGPEIDFMRAKYNIEVPTLHFQDYCVKEFIVENPLPKLSDKDGEIHIVHTGSVFRMDLPKEKYGYSQYVEIAKMVIAQRIHFHIYPNPYQLESLPHYEELAELNPYFRMHKGLLYRDLGKEVSKYDYGWLAQDFRNTIIQDVFYKTAIGNRLFGYLEAGLPIIASDSLEYVATIINKNGIGLMIDTDDLVNLSSKLRELDYRQLQNNVKTARRSGLSMENHIHRLEMFYQKMATTGRIQ